MAQQSNVGGDNNIVIQIEGDHNQVNLAYLTLTRYLNRREIQSEADLLSPYTRSIPLVGRDQEMADLRAWLQSPKPIAIRVLTGRAGSGKTRLALEMCEQLLGEGWHAGFIDSGELARFRQQQNLATWGWRKPTLAVMDDAATHAAQLHDWLVELANNQGDPKKPLRLLLLERNAEPGLGWWQTAFGRGTHSDQAIWRLLDPDHAVEVARLDDRELRRRIFADVLARANEGMRPPAIGEAPGFDQQLDSLTWGGEPLFLMVAGLLAAKHRLDRVLALSRTDLAFNLAQRELARIADIGDANGLDPDFCEAMAGYVTLCRGLDKSGVMTAVPAEQEALGLPSAGDPGKVAKVLHDALPGPDGRVEPILPDMIGEAAILRAGERYGTASAGSVVRAFAQDPEQVAATVMRTAQDFVGQKIGNEEILAPVEWLDAIRREAAGLDQLMLIGNGVTDVLGPTGRSLALAAPAARVFAAIAEHLRPIAPHGDLQALQRLWFAVGNLANRLRELGSRREALVAAEEAVKVSRELAAKAPNAFRPDLALSLSNLANILSDLDQQEDALGPAKEAVSIYRELAAEMPDAFRHGLAMSLNNLANRLSDFDQLEDAVRAAKEAVSIYGELAAEMPDAFRHGLAMSLNTLASSLSDLSRPEEALCYSKKMVAICGELAAKTPDAFQPDLARGLQTLGKIFWQLGQHKYALAAVEKAVTINRELTAMQSDAFGPDLAESLAGLAVVQHDLGRKKESLTLTEEAVTTLRPHFVAHPLAFLQRMKTLLRNYAHFSGELGREPDGKLLGPILKVIERLQAEGGRSGEQ